MSARVSKSERDEAIVRLHEWLKPGDTVYCILRSVSRSGMSRVISFIKIDSDAERAQHGRVSNSLKTLDYNIGIALDYKRVERGDGLKVNGGGMDMGFHVVYSLGRVLFPDGFGEPCTDDECTYRPASKAEAAACNANLREGVTPHHFRGRNGDTSGWDNDGGYALSARWL